MAIGEAVAAVVAAATLALGAAAPPVAFSARSPSAVPGAVDVAGGWGWPFEPRPDVARGFDPPDRPWLAGHRGVDLTASVGQRVLTPAGGEITFNGQVAGRGVVVVQHTSGLRSTLEPVEDGPVPGTSVSAGDTVGVVAGASGHCAPATCVHWGVRRGKDYVDPFALLGLGPIILLPLH